MKTHILASALFVPILGGCATDRLGESHIANPDVVNTSDFSGLPDRSASGDCDPEGTAVWSSPGVFAQAHDAVLFGSVVALRPALAGPWQDTAGRPVEECPEPLDATPGVDVDVEVIRSISGTSSNTVTIRVTPEQFLYWSPAPEVTRSTISWRESDSLGIGIGQIVGGGLVYDAATGVFLSHGPLYYLDSANRIQSQHSEECGTLEASGLNGLTLDEAVESVSQSVAELTPADETVVEERRDQLQNWLVTSVAASSICEALHPPCIDPVSNTDTCGVGTICNPTHGVCDDDCRVDEAGEPLVDIDPRCDLESGFWTH